MSSNHLGRDVRSRVDPGSKAAAQRLVSVIAARDHPTTREILDCGADLREVARWLAHQIVASEWVAHPRDYTERLARRAETEMVRCERELLAERDPR